MACQTCGGGNWIVGVCRVCELLDKDSKIKLVKYCSICSAHICKKDWLNPLRRIKAFGKQFFV